MVIAIVIDVTLFYLGEIIGAFDEDVINPTLDDEFRVDGFIILPVVAFVIGTLGYFIVDRIVDNTAFYLRVFSTIGGLLSLGLPLGIDDLQILTFGWLLMIHSVTVVSYIYFVTYRSM